MKSFAVALAFFYGVSCMKNACGSEIIKDLVPREVDLNKYSLNTVCLDGVGSAMKVLFECVDCSFDDLDKLFVSLDDEILVPMLLDNIFKAAQYACDNKLTNYMKVALLYSDCLATYWDAWTLLEYDTPGVPAERAPAFMGKISDLSSKVADKVWEYYKQNDAPNEVLNCVFPDVSPFMIQNHSSL